MAKDDAVIMSEKLNDIRFPEFTAKLVTDTFDAIIAANLRQTESYIELVGAISKNLTTYINDTKDDISGAEILQFLATTLPPATGQPTGRVAVGTPFTSGDATVLSAALKLPDPSAAPTLTASTSLTQQEYQTIAGFAAQRLAANKYTVLQQMVKMGLLRLVVTDGKIVSQLTFSTWSYSFYSRNSSSYNTTNFDLTVNAKTGSALSRWFSASAAAKYTNVSVRTTNETQQDNSGSSVNIFGRVEINFKTDYQPLNQ